MHLLVPSPCDAPTFSNWQQLGNYVTLVETRAVACRLLAPHQHGCYTIGVLIWCCWCVITPYYHLALAVVLGLLAGLDIGGSTSNAGKSSEG